ncbi:uncharacterized protein LOC142882280 [Nelusetta ayraudi]|uniref:uncharacterized protein LOC142882280 n=1 Tax=Nelusetta ayraudi TaxID=303726 RepID=UPI003F6EB098
MMRGEWRASRSFRAAAEEEMLSGCRVVNGQNRHPGRDEVRTPAHHQHRHHQLGLEVQTPAHMANGGSGRSCSTYQDETSGGGGRRRHLRSAQAPRTGPAPSRCCCCCCCGGQSGQEGLKKVCRSEEDGPCPFPGLAAGVLEMRVKEGSKIRNLMGFAMARVQGGGGGQQQEEGLRQVVFSGSGRAVTKTITCAEIMKRKVGDLHQLTKLRYKVVREVWESAEGGGGAASGTTVHRTVPSISILLSKDPLDPQEPGYQPPEAVLALWGEAEEGGGAEGGSSSSLAPCKRRAGPGPGPDLPYGPGTPPRWKRARLAGGVSVQPPPQ